MREDLTWLQEPVWGNQGSEQQRKITLQRWFPQLLGCMLSCTLSVPRTRMTYSPASCSVHVSPVGRNSPGRYRLGRLAVRRRHITGIRPCTPCFGFAVRCCLDAEPGDGRDNDDRDHIVPDHDLVCIWQTHRANDLTTRSRLTQVDMTQVAFISKAELEPRRHGLWALLNTLNSIGSPSRLRDVH